MMGRGVSNQCELRGIYGLLCWQNPQRRGGGRWWKRMSLFLGWLGLRSLVPNLIWLGLRSLVPNFIWLGLRSLVPNFIYSKYIYPKYSFSVDRIHRGGGEGHWCKRQFLKTFTKPLYIWMNLFDERKGRWFLFNQHLNLTKHGQIYGYIWLHTYGYAMYCVEGWV